ncbi:MAG: hypothetical protein FD122_643 [Stygiobacter sp.]|nr:MAG: hypothetical protein FD122_643 [Stygiobacter sp.]KAF0214825.1 MAG: hypothetical protein FD178_2133 [Ignavibacteria bacterium]
MKPFFALVVVGTLTFFSFSCDNPTDSRPRIIRPPQDMIWTADTLKGFDQYAQLTPENLLVFSPNDAWLVCWSDIARRLIWHFDGKSWNESNISADVGGMRVRDIAGYSSSDLWVCGYTGDEIFLAHYDGSSWTKYNTNGIKGDLLDMCKDADGNLWACGRKGMIMKFDKNKWSYETFKAPTFPNSEFFFKSATSYGNKIHLLLTTIRENPWSEKYYYITGQTNNWSAIDSIIIDSPSAKIKWGYRGLHAGISLWSHGIFGLWQYDGNNWIQKLSINNAIDCLYESASDYLIAVGDSKTARHFNGTNWINISSIFNISDPSFIFRNVWTNGYETFICGYGNFGTKEKLVIWRGK